VALEIENARLKAENERLKRRLAIAKGVAENIRQGAKNRMDAGDLPRGNFAYLKGAYVSSDKISKTLG
jgi:regulator of replication initiation timing